MVLKGGQKDSKMGETWEKKMKKAHKYKCKEAMRVKK